MRKRLAKTAKRVPHSVVTANNRVRASRSIRTRKHRAIKASTDLSNPYIKIFLTNLGKYNEGELIGEWVDLPVSNFDSVLKKIGINNEYEEYFITDFDTNIPRLRIGEYDNLDELNELASAIKNMDETQILIMSEWLEQGASVEEAVEQCDDGSVYYECYSDQDLGYELVDMMGGVENLDRETLEMYFDYDSYGRSESINRSIREVESGTWVELYQ